jgi:hypothetical protein
VRQFQELLEILGAAGVLGLGVLLFCGVFYITSVTPAENEVVARRTVAEQLTRRTLIQNVSSATGAAAELSQFQSLFPPVEQLTDEMERLHALARDAGLELQQGEYRLESRGEGLAAYRVILPLRGSYPQIRRFMDAILRDMPIASVDALRFERKKVGETRLDAQFRLTIHLRSAPGNAPG